MRRRVLHGATGVWFALIAGYCAAAPTAIIVDDSLDDARREALETAFRQANVWVNARTGRPSPSGYVLAAGAGSVAGILEASKGREGDPGAETRRQPSCDGPKADAVSTGDLILVCFPKGSRRVDMLHLSGLMAQELFRQLQMELSASREDGATRLGPEWLVEGSADVLEFLYIDALLPADGPGLFDIQNPARRSRTLLADLRATGSVADEATAGMSRFAASLLARRYGVDGFINYFKGLGEGLSQDAAFATTFGLTMDDFDAEFERVRRDFGAARDWGIKK